MRQILHRRNRNVCPAHQRIHSALNVTKRNVKHGHRLNHLLTRARQRILTRQREISQWFKNRFRIGHAQPTLEQGQERIRLFRGVKDRLHRHREDGLFDALNLCNGQVPKHLDQLHLLFKRHGSLCALPLDEQL